jgi:hypothetical protein
MAGRTPKPPEGWDDTTPTTGSGSGKPAIAPAGAPAEGIVRPAGQH